MTTQQTAQHTKEPWTFNEEDFTIRSRDFESLAGMWDCRGIIIAELDAPNWRRCRPDSIPEKKANARLIAECPAMYDYILIQARRGDMQAQKLIDKIEGK